MSLYSWLGYCFALPSRVERGEHGGWLGGWVGELVNWLVGDLVR